MGGKEAEPKILIWEKLNRGEVLVEKSVLGFNLGFYFVLFEGRMLGRTAMEN